MHSRIFTSTFVIAALLGLAVSSGHVAPSLAASSLRRCAANMPHAKVPRIDGLSYDAARKKTLAAGWAPRVVRAPDGTIDNMIGEYLGDAPELDDGNIGIFWSRGYHEVENCAGTGLGQCVFNFTDSHGNRLQIETAGEEDAKGSAHAIVDRVSVLCRR